MPALEKQLPLEKSELKELLEVQKQFFELEKKKPPKENGIAESPTTLEETLSVLKEIDACFEREIQNIILEKAAGVPAKNEQDEVLPLGSLWRHPKSKGKDRLSK